MHDHLFSVPSAASSCLTYTTLCISTGAAERNFAGGDGASKADPGIFEILYFFATVRYGKNLALVEGFVEILPRKKLKSRMN